MESPIRIHLPGMDASAYEQLLERTGALVYVVDRREQVLTINRNLRSRADLDATTIGNLQGMINALYPDPAFRDNVMLTHQRVMAGAPKREVEWVMTTRQGEQRQVRWQFLTVEQADDRYLVVVGEDVTDRRKLEQWVRLQNTLLGRVADAIIVADVHGRVLHWTGGGEKLLGYGARAAMERPLANIIMEDGARVVQEWMEELQEKGESEWVRALRREAGDSIECRVRGSKVVNERGQIVGIALLAAPFSAPKETVAVPSEDVRLEKVVGQTSLVAVVTTDADGVVRTWGRGAERLGGIAGSRAVGKMLFDDVMKAEGYSWESLSSRLAGRGRFQARVQVERPNGTRIYAELDALAIKDGESILSVVCFFSDRSELQSLSDEALHTKRRALESVFLDGVIRKLQDTCTYFDPDHRFVLARLADLRSLARIVRQGAPIREVDRFVRSARILEVEKDLEETMYQLGEGVHRLRSLVDDIGRFEAGEVDPPGPVRVIRELESARELVCHAFENQVSVEVPPEDLPPARASRAPLMRGLCLLLLASAETCAGQEGARVQVEGQSEGGWIHLDFRDNGLGFGVDVQSRLGDLVYLATQPGYAPLFLGMARESIRAAGGSLEVNTAAGSGTHLRVSFPGAEAVAQVQPMELSNRRGVPRGKVLLVEEDDLLRRALERHIGETHEVVSFSNLTEAMSGFGGCEAAVVAFPRPDGIGLRLLGKFAEVAPQLFHTTLVMVSPGLKFATRDKLLSLGAVVLSRPVDLTTLRSLLLRILPGDAPIDDEVIPLE